MSYWNRVRQLSSYRYMVRFQFDGTLAEDWKNENISTATASQREPKEKFPNFHRRWRHHRARNQCQETSEVELQQVAYPGVAGRFFGPLSLGKIMAFYLHEETGFCASQRASFLLEPLLLPWCDACPFVSVVFDWRNNPTEGWLIRRVGLPPLGHFLLQVNCRNNWTDYELR